MFEWSIIFLNKQKHIRVIENFLRQDVVNNENFPIERLISGQSQCFEHFEDVFNFFSQLVKALVVLYDQFDECPSSS